MSPLVISEFLAANANYVNSFDKGSLPLPPGRKVAIVTCMDARIDPAKALGLQEGDAHVIRNAGGLAREALRSLVISQQLLGTKEIVLVQHTGCGMLTFKQEDAVAAVKQNIGKDASGIDFQPFADLEESVRDNVAFLKGSNLIPDDIPIWGGVYEVETGRIRKVD